MGNANFSDDFKRDAVAQISERGYPVAEVSQRLGVSQHSLYEWKKKFSQRSSHGTRALSCRHRTGLLANPIFAAATIGFGASRLQSYEAGHCWGAHTASGGWIAAMPWPQRLWPDIACAHHCGQLHDTPTTALGQSVAQ